MMPGSTPAVGLIHGNATCSSDVRWARRRATCERGKRLVGSGECHFVEPMIFTRRSFLSLIGIATIAGAWFLHAGTPRAAKPTNGTSIVAFGDSLVEGRGATPGNDFVSVLS